MNLLIMAAFSLFAQKIDNGYVIDSHLIQSYSTREQCYTAGSAYPWNPAWVDSIHMGHYYSYRLVCTDKEPVIAKDVPINPYLLRP